MLKRQEEENLYFSTKVELRINNVTYRPAICYKVPPLAKRNLEEYESKGKVTFYSSPVRFVNGGLAPVLTEQSSAVSSVVRSEERAAKISKRKGK